MKLLVANCGWTVTPKSPRSELEQMGLSVMAAVPNRAPFWYTRSAPPWVPMSRRPSGVKASAVGEPMLVTSWSTKLGGRAARAGPGRPARPRRVEAKVQRAAKACRIMRDVSSGSAAAAGTRRTL